MQSLDLEILEQLTRWLANGEQPWLCTIIRTTGSSPRPVGSMLAYHAGDSIGTLSGGCVEEDLLAKLEAGDIGGQPPQRVEYGVSAEENERLGLPCGGRLEILVEALAKDRADWVAQAQAALKARKMVARVIDLTSGDTTLEETTRFTPLVCDQQYLRQSLGPRMQLLLVGAGQLAQVLASLSLAMDFDVVVTDPRETALNQWAGPDVPLILGLPDDVIINQGVDRHTVIITLTHDPRIDDMALLEALDTDAWYVGALGSMRTTKARLERLRTLGVEDAKLARLHAPVGLDIGSKTPWEIAVAIMAEITQLKRRNSGTS